MGYLELAASRLTSTGARHRGWRATLMPPATHAVTMNGQISFQLKGRDGRSPEEEMVRLLGRLDGLERFSMIVWAIPTGVPFDRVNVAVYPFEYIQCAGGANDRFVCEVREGAQDAGRQYALGRPELAAQRDVVTWGGFQTTVRTSEVLDRDEVAALFVEYLRSGGQPNGYLRRELDLG